MACRSPAAARSTSTSRSSVVPLLSLICAFVVSGPSGRGPSVLHNAWHGVPSRLGRYVVRRRLGSGGFATVWLAHDEQLDAEVAVKVLADNWAHDDSVRRRFLEEGRFLRRVESEHVVQVHDVGELEDGRPFLVLTYADGGTLAARLQEGPLDLASAVGVIVQVGRGLQALHRRGLLHRDVKPANVLFRRTDDG